MKLQPMAYFGELVSHISPLFRHHCLQCLTLTYFVAKLVPLAYGIQKLQISTVVEDDKVSVDWLTETIQEIEDLVQSVDIAAFNKI